ncbi:sporulation initiation phosphotransferase [Bacillus sp. JCM 19046]|uniref:Two-component system response regulator (Stage 0 sporulation protein F) n=1 Tax=Shouchella xiaoxiensis TaxID=766895 RepID=A0ABS2SYL4_9BACI|nr:response regulator [Shouchella xiaoxiensis]MBM7840623.1 two-component system response regulator (stage 0 sporulation protein F) [Shouchella xiaoxiensis]GAF12772.1 sporulation initiation phosphotransferase [Bacillus sp. JCM 19045]GAF16829.1 sporulation initiation phosphotransferase [Bacillus sp. JCM 19046]
MNHKVLIVDDQFGIRVLLTEVLQKDGYEMFQAANGKEALDIQAMEDISIVLLDMKIPGMDGVEILKQLKQRQPSIKVIMMTAYGELKMVNEALENGAISYMAKPFDISDVRQAIRKNLIS